MASDFVAVKDQTSGKDADAEPDLDTRERLVRAAIEVFLEKGYGGTRVQDIARRAGFTSGALYVHFPSRTALLGEAIIREGQTILERIVEQIGAPHTGPDDPAPRRVAAFGAGEPTNLDQLMLEAIALAARSPEARDVLNSVLVDFQDKVTDRIEDAKSQGIIDTKLDTPAVRQAFMALIFGGIATKSLGIAGSSLDDLAEVYFRMMQGLTPRD